MGKYIVIEMQNGIIGSNNWAYDNRDDAEVKMYQVLSEVVKSPVAVHTVMLVTDEGFVLETKCYKHEPEPEPEPEPTPDAFAYEDGMNAQEGEEVPSDGASEAESA